MISQSKFYTVGLFFNGLSLMGIVYLFTFFEPRSGMGGMFDGILELLAIAVCAFFAGVSNIIGYSRKEKIKPIHYLSFVLSALFSLIVFGPRFL